MSKVVDSRVVEMNFDNKQFERNVKTSMGTLEKLKQALQLENAANTFKNVGEAIKNLDLSSIAEGIDYLKDRFSVFGIVGMQVIENLTDMVMNFAGKTLGFLTDSIVAGGKRRAMNIENAHFQLQGLLKDEAQVQAVMKDAMDSVDGTAYAYDSAAKAASQFAATGMRSGAQLQAALRAITGVAAMTNSEYESISEIFTTVAGNGRLMGDQLLQLANRGLNAAATLRDFFNGVNSGSIDASSSVKKAIKDITGGLKVTEADIREFVSDGQLSFSIFSESMDYAFGEHAKKANETFTGALSNVKAALARIGAEFTAPLIAQNGPYVKFLNTLREKINDLKKNIEPLAKLYTDSAAKRVEWATKFLKNIDINKPFEVFYDILEKLRTGLNGIGSIMIDAFKNIGSGFKSIFKPIGQAFREVFPPMGLTAEKVATKLMDVATKFRDATTSFGIGKKTAEDLKNTFKGLFSIIDIVKTVIQRLTGSSGNLSAILGGLAKIILSVTGRIGEWISSFAEAIRVNKKFNDLSKEVESCLDSVKNAFSVFEEKSTPVRDAIFAIGDAFSKVVHLVSQKAGELTSALLEGLKNLTFDDFLKGIESGIFVAIGVMFKKILDGPLSVIGIFKEIGKNMGSIREVLDGVADCLSAFQSQIQAKTLIAIATAIGILAAALLILSTLDWEGVLKGVGSLWAASGILTKSITAFAGMTFKRSFLRAVSGLVALAAAIALLAVPVKVLGSMDIGSLVKGLAAVGTLIGGLAAFLILTSDIDKMSFVRSLGLIALAESINILSTAVTKIAELNLEQTIRGLLAIGTLLAAVFLFVDNLESKSKLTIAGATSLVILSAAIVILTQAVGQIAELNLEETIRGLLAIGSLLAALFIFVTALEDGKLTLSTSVGILALAAAVKVLSGVLLELSGLSWDEIARGLFSLGGALGTVVAAAILMEGTLKGSAAMAVMAASVLLLAGAIKLLSSMSIGEVAIALGVLAGTFTVLALAAAGLQFIAPAMLSLAGVIALFGVGALACGAGVLALSAGLAGLAATGVAGILVLVEAVKSIVALIPFILQQVGLGIVALLTTLGDSVDAIVTAVVQIFNAILEAVAEEIPHVVDVVMVLIGDLILAISENISLWAEQGVLIIASLIEGMGQGLTEHKEEIKEALKAFFKGLIDLALELLGINSPSKVFADMGCNIVLGLIKGIGEKAKELLTKLRDLIKSAIQAVKDKVKDFIERGKDLMVGLKDGIHNKLETVKNKARDVATNAASAIANKASTFLQNGKDLIEKVRSGFASKKDAVVNKAKSIITDAKEGISGMASDLFDAGVNIIEGLIGGIRDKARSVADAAVNAARNAIQAVKDWLGIDSPSKEFAWIGRMSDEGWVVGLKALAPKIYKTASTIGKTTVESVVKAVDGISKAIDDNIDAEPTIRPVLDLTDISKGAASMNKMLSNNRTIDVAGNASISINKATDISANRDRAFMAELKAVIGKSENGGMSVNITNTFNITGDDPRGIADEVSRILQQQVERREASWA